MARILHEAVERYVRGWAQTHDVTNTRGGGISVLQRFGGSLNLNVHVHALVLDGVFARTAGGALRFHAWPAPSSTDVADVLATIVPRVRLSSPATASTRTSERPGSRRTGARGVGRHVR